ncbi:MAG: response regulator [Bacteroidota bacterium]
MELKKAGSKYQSVMIVDDCEIDNYINEIIIKKAGFAENVYKHSGALGSLEFLKNIAMLNYTDLDLLPSVLFLDINMPVLDGFQFLDELNNFPTQLNRKIKIVILSSSANPSDIKKASQYKQVVKFLHKPLTKEDLYNLN